MGQGAIVMRGLTIHALIFFLLCSESRGETACVDPAALRHSAVSITRFFDDSERSAQPNLLGIEGTGWFRSPTTIVTVEHVVAAMGLSAQEWKVLTIQDGSDRWSIPVRIQHVTGGSAEKLAVVELQSAISVASSVSVRASPLAPEDRLVTFVYPDREARSVSGRFVRYDTQGVFAGSALLEMYEGNNRLAIDHGASGAPVFDCEGRVAAVITTVITQVFHTPFGDKRISTAWGTPNVVSVPVRELMDTSNGNAN